jgi:hypothetical protein
MTWQSASRVPYLIRPEESAWRRPVRPAAVGRPRTLSLKAVFWCAAAVGLSLLLGNLV